MLQNTFHYVSCIKQLKRFANIQLFKMLVNRHLLIFDVLSFFVKSFCKKKSLIAFVRFVLNGGYQIGLFDIVHVVNKCSAFSYFLIPNDSRVVLNIHSFFLNVLICLLSTFLFGHTFIKWRGSNSLFPIADILNGCYRHVHFTCFNCDNLHTIW